MIKFIFCLLFVVSAYATDCTYYSKFDSFYYAGYSVNYSSAMDRLMSSAGYTRVFELSKARYIFDLSAKQLNQQPFKKAYSQIALTDTTGHTLFVRQQYSRCYSMSCSVGAMAKNTNKVFVKSRKKFPRCK